MSKSFSALGVSTPVVRTLAERNIITPFAVQSLVLEDALAGVDILAASPTGSGKTLAFGLPVVERTAPAGTAPPRSSSFRPASSPRRSSKTCAPTPSAKGLQIAAVYGGTALGPQAKRAKQAHILVATPGRLHDLIERGMVQLGSVRVLVLDEADRMLDMGFRPQVDRILKGVPENRQTMLFSATLDGPVADLARRYTVERRSLHRRCADRGEAGRDRAPLRARHDRRQARGARRKAPRRRARARTRLRPHQARRGQARPQALSASTTCRRW